MSHSRRLRRTALAVGLPGRAHSREARTLAASQRVCGVHLDALRRATDAANGTQEAH